LVSAWLALFSFDVVLATIAFNYLSGQGCHLEKQWKIMFSQKSTQIQAIQEAVSSTFDVIDTVSMLWVHNNQGPCFSIPRFSTYGYGMC